MGMIGGTKPAGSRLDHTRDMQPYEIVTRRVTVYAGALVEIPLDAPADLRTWTCHAFFVPSATVVDLRPTHRRTQVDGSCWAYGGRHWLELTLKDIGMAQGPAEKSTGPWASPFDHAATLSATGILAA